MIKWVKKKLKKPDVNLSQKETRLEQMKKNPYKRVDSENMSEIVKWINALIVRRFLLIEWI